MLIRVYLSRANTFTFSASLNCPANWKMSEKFLSKSKQKVLQPRMRLYPTHTHTSFFSQRRTVFPVRNLANWFCFSQCTRKTDAEAKLVLGTQHSARIEHERGKCRNRRAKSVLCNVTDSPLVTNTSYVRIRILIREIRTYVVLYVCYVWPPIWRVSVRVPSGMKCRYKLKARKSTW